MLLSVSADQGMFEQCQQRHGGKVFGCRSRDCEQERPRRKARERQAGAVIGLRVVAVVLVFAVYSACVDPDRVLRALRPVARRSAPSAAAAGRAGITSV